MPFSLAENLPFLAVPVALIVLKVRMCGKYNLVRCLCLRVGGSQPKFSIRVTRVPTGLGRSICLYLYLVLCAHSCHS